MITKVKTRRVLTAKPLPREPQSSEICALSSKDALTLCQLFANPSFRIIDGPRVGEVIHSSEALDDPVERVASEVGDAAILEILRMGMMVSPLVCRRLVVLHEFWEGDQKCGRRDRARLVRPNVGVVLDAISSNLKFAASNCENMLLHVCENSELLSYDTN